MIVHHSSGNLGLNFNPARVIAMLRERIGTQGHLVMLALPFTSRSLDYLKSHPVFDLQGSSQMGILSEVLRRSPGVYRTPHPISSVCIQGPRAEEIAAAHKNLEYAFSEDSAYGYGLREGAKIIGLGVEVTTLSPMHYLEYLRRERYPIYDNRLYPIKLLNKGVETTFETRPLNPHLLRRWKPLKEALNRHAGSVHFIRNGRVFYAYHFDILKSVVFDLMDQNNYFKPL